MVLVGRGGRLVIHYCNLINVEPVVALLSVISCTA